MAPMKNKPARKQLEAALEVQAPFQTPNKSVLPRSLKQAGVGQFETLDYYKAAEWFDDEDTEVSQRFIIMGARLYDKGQYQDQVIFKLKDAEGNLSLCSLTANEPRMAYVRYFNTDSTPLGPCNFVKLDTGQKSPYYDIQDAEDELPF
jgi:hypothetical protein